MSIRRKRMPFRLTCPRCGAQYAGTELLGFGDRYYLYMYHYSPEFKRLHKWIVGSVKNPEVIDFAKKNKVPVYKQRVVLKPEDPAFDKVLEAVLDPVIPRGDVVAIKIEIHASGPVPEKYLVQH